MSILQRLVTDLKGVGGQVAAKLAKIEIKTIQDVVFHLPTKYVDRTRIYPIGTTQVEQVIVIEGIINKVNIIPKPKRSLQIIISDSTGILRLRFFYFSSQQAQQFVIGKKIRCFGTIKKFSGGLQMIHPEYTICAEDAILPVEEYLTPIYPATDGISQKFLRSLVQQALLILRPIKDSIEILPQELRAELEFLSLYDILQQIHFPTPECYTQMLNKGFHPAQKQLAFEELLAHHLSLRKKRTMQQQSKAYAIAHDGTRVSELLASLPFELTRAQLKVYSTLKNDLAKHVAMLRLVQGDVGCGKTLVALMAALLVIESGLQVAFMVPTEILAQQHFSNIKKLLNSIDIKICCISASLSEKDKRQLKEDIRNNQYQLIIGTHALFQDDVEFAKLGLAIIDEQHKFGVAQRLALQKKGLQADYTPHQLILTATPIPRTLAMTFYADLDYSVIDELPPGRKPVNTIVVSDKRRVEVLERVANICAKGQQVYWVCTVINESEVSPNKAAESVWQELQQQLPDLTIGLIHAKLATDVKETIMQDFKQGKIDVLVATTVIEVGVDVANASLMIIENPERLGLAQLHQLRGRVGRSELQSYCLLLYKPPLGERGLKRLQCLRDTNDGFAVAEFDLQLRGPGEVFGTKQSGLANLRIANLVRDKELLPQVANQADKILQHHPNIIPLLLSRWIREQLEYAVV